MVRLTDRPDMTLDVYCGRKTTIQQLNVWVLQRYKSDFSETIRKPSAGVISRFTTG